MDDEATRTEQLSGEIAADVETVAKGGAVQIVGQIAQRSVTFFFSVVAFHILGKSGFGLYRKIAQTIGIASQLGLAGFNYGSMRWIARSRAVGDQGGVRGAARVGLAGAAITSSLVMIVLILFADVIVSVYRGSAQARDYMAFLLRTGAPYVPLFALMQVLRYCTQAYRTMVPSVMTGTIIQPLARFILGIAALAAGFAVTGAIATLAIAAGVGTIAGVWYFRRILTSQERAAKPHTEVGPMVRFSFLQAGSSLLGIQTLGLGVIILGIVEGDASVGLFAAAVALQGPGSVFLGGILNIWAPVVSELHQRGDIERLGSLYQTITRWVATFSFPVFAALMLEPDLFARIYGGEALDAAPAIAILAAGNLFFTGTGPTGYVLSMTGRPGVNLVNSIAAVVAYVGLGLAVVPRFGFVGMAVVDAAVTAAVNTARVIEAKVLVGIQPFGHSFLKPVIATFVGALFLFAWRLLPGDSLVLGIAGVVVAAIAYVLTLLGLGLDAEERYVWSGIRRRIPRLRKQG